jgi:hypothetical protein
VEVLRAIERFIFMHFRLSGYFSTYKSSFFFNLAHSLYVGEKDINFVIEELEKIDYMNKNEQISVDALNRILRLFKNYKGYYSWATSRYFLYEYETYIMNGEANQKIYPEDIFKKDEKDKVSIEHIYPQTPVDEYWKSRFDKYSEEERNCLNGSLGNLLPLSLSINIKLQNDSFDKKKETRYYKGSHSEIEVSHYPEWNAETILDHGNKMLDFMSKRWNFKFRNDYDKARLLGLEFMVEKPNNIMGEELEDKLDSRAITKEMVVEVYELSKQVYEKQLDYENAVKKMTEQGMNSNSAKMYIDCFVRMIEGEVYKRATSSFAAELYINKIREDYGKEKAEKAIESLEKHIKYLKGNGYSTKSLEQVFQEQKEMNL